MDIIALNQSLKDAQAALETEKAEHAKTAAKVADLEARAKTAETEKARADKAELKIASIEKEKGDVLASIETLKGEHATALKVSTDEVSKLKAEAKSVEQRVTEITGGKGNEPVAVVSDKKESDAPKLTGTAAVAAAMKEKFAILRSK